MFKNIIVQIGLLVTVAFIALLVGYVVGSNNLSYRSNAELSRGMKPATLPQGISEAGLSVDSLTNSITGRITQIQDLDTDKKAIEVTGISFGNMMGLLPNSGVSMSGRPTSGAVSTDESNKLVNEQKYPVIVNSSTVITQLSMVPRPMALSDFIGKPPPSPIPPQKLTIDDLKVDISVTVYFDTDGVTAKKITAIPSNSVSKEEIDLLLESPPPFPSDIPLPN